jgi:RimJ/RimL family protein N-acetyltransferase
MNLENIKLEKTKPEDIKGISEVLSAAWKVAHHSVSHEEIDKMFTLTDEDISEWTDIYNNPGENRLFITAKLDSKPIGFIAANKQDSNIGQIKAIYILPEFHGKGIGTRLMHVALYWLRECKEIFLDCASYNSKAISFYKRFDFGNQKEIEPYITKLGSKIPQSRLTKKLS